MWFSSRQRGAAGMAVLTAAALSYTASVDPHRSDTFFPGCPFHFITGWDCPACGGLRMTHDLMHGNIAAAAADNAFLLGGLPMVAVWILWRQRRGQRLFPMPVVIVLAVAALTWTVTRNITDVSAIADNSL